MTRAGESVRRGRRAVSKCDDVLPPGYSSSGLASVNFIVQTVVTQLPTTLKIYPNEQLALQLGIARPMLL